MIMIKILLLKNLIKLTSKNFTARLKQANLVCISNKFSNKFSILDGAKYFSLGIFQNYLVFIPAKKYIKYLVALVGLNPENLT